MNHATTIIFDFVKGLKPIFLVLFIATALRLWNLGSFPPSLRSNEASFGYNAYSILKTGKDESGEFLPILFKSFGDWKPGTYFYLTVPFVAILGLNEWAVRLPAAISGVLSIYLLYLLVLSLFGSQKFALASAFSLSISPWHIAFSRGAWDAEVALTLTLAGMLFFIKSLNQNNKYLIVSAGFFGMSLLTSHGAKPAIPFLLLSFLLAYWKKIIIIPSRIILLSSFLFIILSLPIIFSFFNGKNTRVASLLFTNKYQDTQVETIAHDFFKSWANHYSLPALFIKGDGNPQHSAADFGAFITLDIVFLFLGLQTFIKLNGINKEVKIFMLILLILAPLSSVLAGDVNFERYLMFFIPMNIILGLGINNFKKNLFWGIFLLLYLFSFLLFLDSYFIHTMAKNGAWQTGYKDIVNHITPIQSKYQKIYVPQGGDQPYIFFLFYKKYPPEKFQSISTSVNIPNGSGTGMDYVSSLDNIEFVDFNRFNLPMNQKSLIVLPVNDTYKFEASLKTIYEIKDPIGFTLYKIAEYNPK